MQDGCTSQEEKVRASTHGVRKEGRGGGKEEKKHSGRVQLYQSKCQQRKKDDPGEYRAAMNRVVRKSFRLESQ